jgi:hypothetical protein
LFSDDHVLLGLELVRELVPGGRDLGVLEPAQVTLHRQRVMGGIDFSTSDCWVVPLSDGDGRRDGAGTHWSLFWIARSDAGLEFEHMDSSRTGINTQVADHFARMLQPSLKRFCPPKSDESDQRDVRHVRCATQRDGVSCGAFVLEFVERKLRRKDVAQKMEDTEVANRRGQVRRLLELLCDRLDAEEMQALGIQIES